MNDLYKFRYDCLVAKSIGSKSKLTLHVSDNEFNRIDNFEIISTYFRYNYMDHDNKI